LESYLCEPLGTDLYLAGLYERFDRYLTGRTVLMRPWLWFIRRAAIAFALTKLDFLKAGSLGHTHIAVFRKAATNGWIENCFESRLLHSYRRDHRTEGVVVAAFG
jgi:hypothetical protein